MKEFIFFFVCIIIVYMWSASTWYTSGLIDGRKEKDNETSNSTNK